MMRGARKTAVRSAVVLVVAVLLASTGALPAPGDTLTVESFTGAAVGDPAAWVAGGDGLVFADWPGKACLSAGTNTSQTPIPGCVDPAIDPVGSGVLRLTTLQGNTGFALFNEALPTSGGLDISFQQAQYGGSGADGLALFLVDGSTDLTQPGAGGGNLGYSPGDQGDTGVDNGLIGIGVDSWGNYSTSLAVPPGTNCTASPGEPGSAGVGFSPDRIAIRGPGNGTTGYCWLGGTGDLGELSGATRAAATKTVRVVVDPDTVATRMVTVFLDGAQVLQIPAPGALLAATSFKFGFSASIGGANDYHEVWNLTIESVIPVTPVAPTAPVEPPVSLTPTLTG
jgi:hypothetical protein